MIPPPHSNDEHKTAVMRGDMANYGSYRAILKVMSEQLKNSGYVFNRELSFLEGAEGLHSNVKKCFHTFHCGACL
jgi:hypothetical protein